MDLEVWMILDFKNFNFLEIHKIFITSDFKNKL